MTILCLIVERHRYTTHTGFVQRRDSNYCIFYIGLLAREDN